jgi:hypothetical protein
MPERRFRNWKLIDTLLIEQIALYLLVYNPDQYLLESLEIYILELTRRIQEIIDSITLWKRRLEIIEY